MRGTPFALAYRTVDAVNRGDAHRGLDVSASMSRFFLHLYGPIYATGTALGVLVLGWIIRPGLLPSPYVWLALVVGTAVGGAFWTWRHFSPRPIPRRYLDQPRVPVPSLGELARARRFHVGTIGSSQRLDQLETVLGTHFTSLTPTYETKWKHLLVKCRLGRYNFAAIDRLVDYACARGVRVRGHTLVWGQHGLPEDLVERIRDAADPAGTLREILEEYITTVLQHFRDRIEEWDVVNEPIDSARPALDRGIFQQTLGDDYIDFVFRCARRADEKCRLFLNEQLWDYTGPRARRFLELIRHLRAQGTPIDGIGLQSHVNVPPVPPPETFRAYLAQIAALGYEIEITEFDALLRLFRHARDPYVAQANYFERMFEICLQQPACRGFTIWGLSDADAWYAHAPHYQLFGPHEPFLFDEAMRPKPAYWTLCDALQRDRASRGRPSAER